ncbi:MAG TPA: NADH-quinone oxidoreductase subunit N [Candidatus Acidoferrales bacterium]|nr:NADH-quinone oxidoreductase subunit N [Candidatus Acidoferrales bacterium]
MSNLTTLPVISYSWSQAAGDLTQIAPIAIVTVALLVAIVADLMLPLKARGPAVAVLSAVALAAALVVAWVEMARGGGHLAYHGYVSGDDFALFFEILLALLGLFTVVMGHSYVRRRGLLESEFHVLTLAAIVGMMALASATSLITVFVALETFSLALYVMSGYLRRETRSQEAAIKYLVVGGFASAFVLYGMALIYGATGTTVLSTIAARLSANALHNPLVVLGMLLLVVGFAFKISGVPFHQWTPDVYQGAPLPVTAFMSVGTKAAGFAMVMRVFNGGLVHLSSEWGLALALVAAASMIVGNVAAIAQSSVKRLLAYSTVAQAGYVLVGVVAGGPSGVGGALFYLFAYLFMNFGAFAILGELTGPDGEHDQLIDLDGLGSRSPLLAIAMSIFMLALAGFPPLVGFIGKFFLFSPGVKEGWTWLVVIGVLTSVVSVFYYLKVLIHVWTPVGEVRVLRITPPQIAIGAAALVALALGIYPSVLYYIGLLGANALSASR